MESKERSMQTRREAMSRGAVVAASWIDDRGDRRADEATLR
jgi:hypothetical protein